ncbi:MAG: hypothetical protein OEX07_00285, partial [Gammaproteobacteria bacterium]|nr:hypothetical protein [Gammaproteobacteria bacterium]
MLINLLLLSACGGGGGNGGTGGTGGTSSNGGSSTNPQVLTFGSGFNYNGYMQAGQSVSYYRVVGLIAGEDYRLTLNSSADIAFFGNDTIDYSAGVDCWTTSANSTATCPANASGELIVIVYTPSTLTTQSSFSLSMASRIVEGSPTAPKNLAALLPYSSAFTETNSKSYFVIDGLTVGNSYTLGLDPGSDINLDLFLFNDAFSTEVCSSTSYLVSAKSCTFTASSDSICFSLEGSGSFTVSNTDNGAVAAFNTEGESTIPTILSYTADGLLHSGEVDKTSSYYLITGLAASTDYRVYINNIVDDNVDLYAYSDSSLSVVGCESTKTRVQPEKCVLSSDLSGSIWLRISGENAHQFLGATFDISVYTYYPNEGSGLADGELAVLNYVDGFSYNGMADTFSYYRVQGLAPDTSYLIDVSGYSVTAPVKLTAYGVYSTVFDRCDGRELVTGVLHCIVSSTDLGEIELVIGEGTSVESNTFNISMSLSPYQSEGSRTNPVLMNMTPAGIDSSVVFGSLDSYYRVDGLIAGAAYKVTIDLLINQTFYVYADGGVDGSWPAVSYDCRGYSSKTSCTVKALTSRLWIQVAPDASVDGASLPIRVVESTYQAEGSIAAPVTLAYGSTALPYSAGVDASESYFEITGLSAGIEYVLSLDNMISESSASAYVYDDVSMFGSTVTGDYVCTRSAYNNYRTFCRITPTSTSIWMMVDGYDPGTGVLFDIDAMIAPVAESLTIDASSLAVFPRVSSTNELSSQYTLTNLDPNQLYIITIDKHQDDIDLRVSGNGFPGYICDQQPGTTLEQCVIKSSAAGELFIEVAGNNTLYGTVFELGVQIGPSNEGSVAALVDVAHTAGVVTSRSSSVGELASYYKITGLDAGRMYEVSIIGASKTIRMEVATSATYASWQCTSNASTSADAFCAVNADASGVLYVGIDGVTEGAEFTLEVKDGLIADGNEVAPLNVAYTAPLTTTSGQVDTGASYYEITGLDPKVSYTISVTGPSDDVSLAVHSDAARFFQECASFTA